MGNLTKNFSREEFACNCGCGFNTVDIELVASLQKLRDHFNRLITINSGCRCATHNKNEGGSINSQHLLGRAADINVEGITPLAVQDYLSNEYSQKFGIGRYNTFTHFDTRNICARW